MDKEDTEIRIHNARLLLKAIADGKIVEFARLTGKRQSYWSDVLRGKKAFGLVVGRSLEETFNLPKGWMEADRRHIHTLEAQTRTRGDGSTIKAEQRMLPRRGGGERRHGDRRQQARI